MENGLVGADIKGYAYNIPGQSGGPTTYGPTPGGSTAGGSTGSTGGGNQMRQPYLKGIVQSGEWEKYPEVEHIHSYGWYIGNYPELEEQKIHLLYQLLNGCTGKISGKKVS